jgi:hypothetical protein
MLETLEDRTLPSGTQILFSSVVIQNLNDFLNKTLIYTSDVATITADEIAFFREPQPHDTVDDLKELVTIQSTLTDISSRTTIPLAEGITLRTAIDKYLRDKPDRGKILNQEIGSIPIPGRVVDQLAPEIRSALAGAASPALGSIPSVVPFGFLVRLAQTAIEISSTGRLTSLELARVSGVLQNPAQDTLQFVAPATGPLLVQLNSGDPAHQGLAVLDASGNAVTSVVEGQTYSIQLSLGNSIANYILTLAVVINPSVHEPTRATAQSTGPVPGPGSVGSLNPGATFLLEGISGGSMPISTTRLESGPGTSLGFADTSSLSSNRSLNTTSLAVLSYGGEGILDIARIGEGETQPRGFFILPDEALRLPRLPLDPKEDDADPAGETEERMLPDPLSNVPEPFAEPTSGLAGDGSSLLFLTSLLKKEVPAAESAPDSDSRARRTPRPADPPEATQAAARLGLAAVDEAMKTLCFIPWQNVPVGPTEMENVPPEGPRDPADCQSSQAALGVYSPLTEGTRGAVVDALFGLALSTLLWDTHWVSDRESRRIRLPTPDRRGYLPRRGSNSGPGAAEAAPSH